MKNKKLVSLLASMCLITSILFTGCSGNSSKEKSVKKEETIVKQAVVYSPKGVFNPLLANSQGEYYVTGMVFESLLCSTPDGGIEPKLASKYDISKDNKTFTFHLRDGIKWQDGKPFTANDVAFTIKFIADPKYPGFSFSTVSKIVGAEEFKAGKSNDIKGVKVIDDKTIEFTTKEVYGPALARIGKLPIIAKHIWEKVPMDKVDKETDLLRKPVGTGPFVLKEFEPDQYAILGANKNYWNSSPKIDKYVLKFGNRDAAHGEILSGNVDYIETADVTEDTLKKFKDAGLKIERITYSAYGYMGLNLKMPEFKDKNVRQALMYGINRQGIVDNFYSGNGSPANHPYAPGTWFHPDKGINEYTYNKETAKELLKKAGWEYIDGKMVKNGKPFKVTLKYDDTGGIPQYIQQNLKDIGIDVELLSVEFATLCDQVDAGDYQMYIMANGVGSDPDVTGDFHSKFNENYSNPEVDRLLEEGVKKVTQEERKPIYDELAKTLNDDLPLIFLYHSECARVKKPRLKCAKQGIFGPMYHLEEWYVEDKK